MEPMVIVYLVVGMVIGGAIAWLVVSSRLKEAYSKQIADLQMAHAAEAHEIVKRASSAEAIVEERGKEILKKESEIDQIRNDLEAERQSRVEAGTRLEEAQRSFEEQKRLIDAMKTEMTDTFNALSSAALKSSSEDFLRLASESLGKVVVDTKGRLGEHQATIDGMIKPLADALKRYEEQIKVMEDSRHRAYGSLEEQLRALTVTHESLQRETSNLVSALRRPEVRGRWGEMQLRRVAELAGMSEHCDFEEQVTVDTDKGKARPDMTVKLPGERRIVVDSKVSLSAYLEAVSAATEDERKAGLLKHGQQVRTHMQKLSSKEYWSQFSQSPEFVVLFIPGESFLGAALDADTTLIEDGIQRKVIIATPTTFIALLRAIAYGWRQEHMTKNAQLIGVLGKELYERMRAMAGHVDDVGSAIEKAISAYNKAVGSLETRVLPSLRRFRELGVTGAEEIPVLDPIDQKPRSLGLPELGNESDEG